MNTRETLESLISKRFNAEFWGKDEKTGHLLRYSVPTGENYATLNKQGYAHVTEYSGAFPEGIEYNLSDDAFQRGTVDPAEILRRANHLTTRIIRLERHSDMYSEDKYVLKIETGEFQRYDTGYGHLDTVKGYATLSFSVERDETILPTELEITEKTSGTMDRCASEKITHKIRFGSKPNDI